MHAPRVVSQLLFAIAFLIIILHFLVHPYRILGMDTSIFYMDEKVTLAAWFTSVVYFFAACVGFLSLRMAKKGISRFARTGISIFFLLLSLDEYFEIHEYINTLLKYSVPQETVIGALLYYTWIFPFTAVIIAILLSLFWVTKRETNNRLKRLLSIGIFCFAGVLIAEMIGGALYGLPMYITMVGVEEGLEMVSAIVFLRYMMESSKLFD